MSFALMRRATLRALAPLPAEFDDATDRYWALSLARQGNVPFVVKPQGYYRVHGGNAGHGNDNRGIASRKLQPWLLPQLDATQRALIERKMAAQAQAMPGEVSPRPRLRERLKDIAKQADARRYRSRAEAARAAEAKQRVQPPVR